MLVQLRKRRKDGEAGATLVEFAFVFPLLLLLIFGVVDFGRLIIDFVSVSTASREAARYGTAVGGSPPQYIDCAGIIDAAQAKIVFGGVDDNDITVEWDTGPGTDIKAYCDVANAFTLTNGTPTNLADDTAGTADDIESGDRVVVSVDSEYQALTPIISPFLGTVPLESTDARTIFKGVLGA